MKTHVWENIYSKVFRFQVCEHKFGFGTRGCCYSSHCRSDAPHARELHAPSNRNYCTYNNIHNSPNTNNIADNYNDQDHNNYCATDNNTAQLRKDAQGWNWSGC